MHLPSLRPGREPPSEIRAHWQLLLGCFIGLGCGVSSLWFYSLGLFIKPLAAEFGWSRAVASAGPLVGILTLGCLSPLIGKAIDRTSPRRFAMLSLLGLAAGFALLGSFTVGIMTFLCLNCLLAALACASSPISFTRILVTTFERQRGLALGIAITGTGIGAILAPLAVNRMLGALGWRFSYLSLALVVLLLVPLVHLLLNRKTPPIQRPQSAAAGAEQWGAVFITPQFLRLGLIFLLCSLAVFGTVVHLVPMLTDRGLTPASAAFFASALGIAVIVGRLLTGLLLDRYEANRLGAVLFLLSGTGLWMLFLGGKGFTVAGTLLAGFAIGAEMDLAAFLVSKSFAVRRYSTAFGGIYACVSIGGGFGPLLAGVLYDFTGNYRLWLACAAVALVLAAAMAVLWRASGPDPISALN